MYVCPEHMTEEVNYKGKGCLYCLENVEKYRAARNERRKRRRYKPDNSQDVALI